MTRRMDICDRCGKVADVEVRDGPEAICGACAEAEAAADEKDHPDMEKLMAKAEYDGY